MFQNECTVFSVAHFHPFDPYAPHDPNNGYPQHFCDLNDDEYGRPYLGPYDQHVDASARNPFPKVPPPDTYKPLVADTGKPTHPTSGYNTLPAPLKDLLGRNVDLKLQDAARDASESNDQIHDGQFMKRQNSLLPDCTVMNECAAANRKRQSFVLLVCHFLTTLFLQRDVRGPARSTIRVKGGARASTECSRTAVECVKTGVR